MAAGRPQVDIRIEVAVCDASAVVAALTDSGREGRWARSRMATPVLCATHLLGFEVSSALRRLELTQTISAEQAALAHADLLDLPVDLWPYEAVAARVRDLRGTLSAYDAGYVALAEQLGVPLLTVDRKLARAAAQICTIETP